jgi:hypothetical protein
LLLNKYFGNHLLIFVLTIVQDQAWDKVYVFWMVEGRPGSGTDWYLFSDLPQDCVKSPAKVIIAGGLLVKRYAVIVPKAQFYPMEDEEKALKAT